MSAKSFRIARAGLRIALPLIAAAAAGCASYSPVYSPGHTASVSTIGLTTYQPVTTYQPMPPPTIHFYAPGGTGAIRAGLMNQMRRSPLLQPVPIPIPVPAKATQQMMKSQPFRAVGCSNQIPNPEREQRARAPRSFLSQEPSAKSCLTSWGFNH